MRKRIATGLLGLNRAIYKLACRIYPPQVTDLTEKFREVILTGVDGSAWTISGMPPDRRESRGYEN